MFDSSTWLALVAVVVWVYLLGFRSRFWRADIRLPDTIPAPVRWPAVAAVVPARNEADVIGESLPSLLAQEYPGVFSIIMVDDHSSDGTAETARHAAATTGRQDRLRIVDAPDLAPGWSGKVWAMRQGAAHAPVSDYLLFTDADIWHPPDMLRRLVAKAEVEHRDLVSLMVRLHCRSFWERLLIPAFVFFFQKLYPFPAVGDDRSPVAAAAGGCMLVRREALERAGGLAAIRGALIDDCALARAVKANGGRLWLGLAADSRSIRPYSGLGELWAMVSRSAYTQLRHSPILLSGTVLAMFVLYVMPPLLVFLAPLHGNLAAAGLSVFAWLLMTTTYMPTIVYYGLRPAAGLALPLAAIFYTAMTIDSAWRHWLGRGGGWKGRHYS